MKLVTWNINSVRLRAGLIERLAQEKAPDVICLQETKCPDEHFPHDVFKALGYAHIHINGMKSYNGLAILSKIPFQACEIHHRVGREDCRHTMVRLDIAGGIDLHNLYIPAGGDEPDTTLNDKFLHKLEFVEEITDWFRTRYNGRDEKVIVVGDFNIAPYEHDVWSHKQLLKIVSHTPPETERLEAFYQALPWVDVTRHFVPMEEKAYSWWSYRNRDWQKSNRGRRLDHIWCTRNLKDALSGHEIFTAPRNWEKPSDHVPVIAGFEL